MRKIENLVLKGGGILGTAYAGAYSVLQENKIIGFNEDTPIGDVKRIAGNSAGAIFASLIAVGHSAEELNRIVLDLDFTTFLDLDMHFLKDGGLLKGNNFRQWINTKLCSKLTGKTEPTFSDLHALVNEEGPSAFKDLHIYSLSLETHNTVHFSYETTPNTPIASAVRASMSIPLIFQPYKMPLKNESGDELEYAGIQFVDGGVKYNYPITAFDLDGPNYNTLGLDLHNFSYKTQEEDMILLIYHLVCNEVRKLYVTPGKDSAHFDIAEAVLESLYQCWRERKDIYSGDIIKKNKKASLLNGASFTKAIDNLSAADASLSSIISIVSSLLTEKTTHEDLLGLFVSLYGSNIKPEKNTGKGKKVKAEELFNAEKMTGILLQYFSLLKPFSVLIQTQENMVFDRDANRTIYLDCLGYQFTDFGIPKCNKHKLIHSGMKCTQTFLDMIMY